VSLGNSYKGVSVIVLTAIHGFGPLGFTVSMDLVASVCLGNSYKGVSVIVLTAIRGFGPLGFTVSMDLGSWDQLLRGACLECDSNGYCMFDDGNVPCRACIALAADPLRILYLDTYSIYLPSPPRVLVGWSGEVGGETAGKVVTHTYTKFMHGGCKREDEGGEEGATGRRCSRGGLWGGSGWFGGVVMVAGGRWFGVVYDGFGFWGCGIWIFLHPIRSGGGEDTLGLLAIWHFDPLDLPVFILLE